MQLRAAKAAAKREAAEREWRVHQVAGELARQADLLERHRHRVAQEAAQHQAEPLSQVRPWPPPGLLFVLSQHDGALRLNCVTFTERIASSSLVCSSMTLLPA